MIENLVIAIISILAGFSMGIYVSVPREDGDAEVDSL